MLITFGTGLPVVLKDIIKILVPKIAGSNPAEAIGFFRRKNPQHAFLRRGSKAVYPMSQICGM
jgi:hypothetical protein